MTTPAAAMSAVQAVLNGPAPAYGPQSGLVAVMAYLHEELGAAGIERPGSLGIGMRSDREAVDDAAARAAAAGEPGVFVSSHDGLVYSPAQMITQVHRQLAALGWAATSTPPGAPASGQASPLFYPAFWRSALDQNGLANSHIAMGTASRYPATIPDGTIVPASRLPGGRSGMAYAANVPSGAQKVEAEPNLDTPGEGANRWYGFSFQLSRNFPIDDARFNLLWRVRNDPYGAYPAGLIVHNGQLCFAAGDSAGNIFFERPIGPVATRTWHDVALRVRFSTTAALCSVDGYLDGSGFSGYVPSLPTITPGLTTSYRYGLYRDTSSPNEATAFFQNVAVGTSMGSVLLPGSG